MGLPSGEMTFTGPAMERSTMLLRTVSHLFLWPFSTAMLNNQSVYQIQYGVPHDSLVGI